MSVSTIQRLSQRVKSLEPVVKKSSRDLRSFSDKFLDLEDENDKKQIEIIKLSSQMSSGSQEVPSLMLGEIYDLRKKNQNQSVVIDELSKQNEELLKEKSLAEKIISLLDANTLATALGAAGVAGVFGLSGAGPEIGPGMTAEGGTKASPYIYSGYRTSRRPDHIGIDISGGPWQSGVPISIVKPGVVHHIGDHGSESWGKHVVIRHDDGTYTLHGHLQSINVRVGQKIENKSGAATIIGKLGSTGRSEGPHLHFELGNGWNGTIMGNRDPTSYIDYYVRAGGNVRTTQTSSIASAPTRSDSSGLKPTSGSSQTRPSISPQPRTSSSGQIIPVPMGSPSSPPKTSPDFTSLLQLTSPK